uniref:Myb-like domain-containing protein n=1 Tax=Nothobranchius pienaari TaxID=704102 RepID=A0A1A8QLL0_9TELE
MNACRKRSSYFTPLEQEVLLQTYEEYGHVFSKKSNTAAASKERKAAWEKIAARVNACNSSGEKRTWIQLKMKYKNLIQKANRKRAESMAGQHQDRDASTSTTQLDTLPVKELYKQHLKKSIEKTVMEIKYLDRKLKKVDLAILLLERQLRE